VASAERHGRGGEGPEPRRTPALGRGVGAGLPRTGAPATALRSAEQTGLGGEFSPRLIEFSVWHHTRT
jgi:hypothetical protein